MNSLKKSIIVVLFTGALLTGFTSMAYIQSAHAFSIDFSGLPGFGGNSPLDFLKGPKGDKGDIGPQGPPGKGNLPAHLIISVGIFNGEGYNFKPSDIIIHKLETIHRQVHLKVLNKEQMLQ